MKQEIVYVKGSGGDVLLKDLIFVVILLIPLTIAGVIDYKRRIIPNYCCLIIGLLGLAGALMMNSADLFFVSISYRIIGILPAVFMIWFVRRKPGSAGGGDIKLMAALGFATGITNLFFVLLPATVFGVIWGKIIVRKFIPLGTFLALGTWVWIGWYYIIIIFR